MRHKHSGTVTSIGDSYSSPDHVRVSVVHGPKPRKKKSKDGSAYPGDSRPSSEITVPRSHAKHYTVGQRVQIGIGPHAKDSESRFQNLKRSIITGGKKKS